MPQFLGTNTRSTRKVLWVFTIVIFCVSLHVKRGYMSLIPNHPFSCPAVSHTFTQGALCPGSYLLSIFTSWTHLVYGYIHVFIYCLAHSTKDSKWLTGKRYKLTRTNKYRKMRSREYISVEISVEIGCSSN